jgi:hypothetical protein
MDKETGKLAIDK